MMNQHYKYPRTPHLPNSPGKGEDDIILDTTEIFSGKKIVVTEKMDGESCTMYEDHIHARSIDSKDHPSRHYVKGIHNNIRYHIPKGWRICGENMFAKHSIYYNELNSYFLVHSVWDNHNTCLDWESTRNFILPLGLYTVPVIYIGLFQNFKIDLRNFLLHNEHEGYVIRLADCFHYENFNKSVAKFVRANHVQTDEHWLDKPLIKNNLRN